MDDLISRQVAISICTNAIAVCHGQHRRFEEDAMVAVRDKIKNLPSAKPKRGKWVYKGKNGDWQWKEDARGSFWDEWQCDQCKCVETKTSNFCPNCGAKMARLEGRIAGLEFAIRCNGVSGGEVTE